jgi:prepilin-type processing-associated H-X9-DG protein
MKRNAFTLIELLVVITSIALLAILMMPSLDSVSHKARQVECASNLGQIHSAFPIAQSRGARQAPMYPPSYQWPMVPQTTIENNAIFWCPEGPAATDEVDDNADFKDYELFLREEKGGMYTNFQTTDARPYRLVFDRGDYWEFWFEEGALKDIDSGVDFVFYVSKATPHTAVFQDVSHNTSRVTAVVFRREVIPGWENLSVNAKGDKFIIGAKTAQSNYGINNSVAARDSVAPGAIILLDYDKTIANQGEDMSENLEAAARHMGRSNVLHADGSVTSERPIDLDPVLNPGVWSAD